MILTYAGRDLLHHRRDSATVIGIIAAGLAMFILAMSFVATVSTNADRLLFGTIGSQWLVQPATKSDQLRVPAAAATTFKTDAAATDVRYRLELPAGLGTAGADGQTLTVTAQGVDLPAEPGLGSNFGITADDLAPGRVVLHASVADRLHVTTGDHITLWAATKSVRLTVSRVVTPANPSFVLESWVLVDRNSLASSLYDDSTRVNRILVTAPEGSAAGDRITAAASQLDGTATVKSWRDTSWSSLSLAPVIWGALLTVVMSVTFLVICLGLTSVLYSAMLARLRDFAMFKAIGMRPGQLRRMYMTEVLAWYLGGYALAAAVATLAMLGINAAGISATDGAFTFAVGSTTLNLVPTLSAYLLPLGIGLALSLAILWFPVNKICSQPILDLLEMS